MYKLQTQLTHFRFDNTFHRQGPYNVTWYKLDDEDTDGICLTQDELKQLTDYVANHPDNFTNQNYFACDNDETPGCGFISVSPDRKHPDNLILRKTPQMPKKGGSWYKCMDIQLLNPNGTLNHTYNLNFNLIGKIE